MRSVLLACALAACGYQPGSFAYPHAEVAGQHATIGCLDLSIATRLRTPRAAVVEYDFGNRCEHPAMVDLASVRVFGRTSDGREIPLQAYDPNHELRALPIDARSTGHEAIAYEAETSRVDQICVDAAAIAHAQPQWMCFAGPRQGTRVSEVTR
jgi:hypothetical protein